jgi:hypothetical protein
MKHLFEALVEAFRRDMRREGIALEGKREIEQADVKERQSFGETAGSSVLAEDR